MHYLFLDEAYHDVAGGRAIIVAAWATEQAKLNDHLEVLSDLRQPGKSPILERIVSVFEFLDARAVVARAGLPGSVFRSGEIDRTSDVPAMARPDTIWSASVIFVVAHLIPQLFLAGQDVGTVDVYFDPRSLKASHATAFEKALRGSLVSAAKYYGSKLGTDLFKRLNIRRVQPVEKAKNLAPTKFQIGTWVADRLCAKSDEIISRGGMARIQVEDMSEVVRRTVQQFDGKSFYE
jgi:hypothetical protein